MTNLTALEPRAYYVWQAAAVLAMSRTTFRKRYLDTGRIQKNIYDRIDREDVDRVHEEDRKERQRRVMIKLNRKVA